MLLSQQMPRSQYETLIQWMTATQQGDVLTLHPASAAARDWLENRLHGMLLRTAESVAGRSVEIRYSPSASSGQANGNGVATSAGPEPAAERDADPVATSEIPRAAAADDLAHFDQLARNWTKHPRYLSLYYQPYFSTFNRFAGSRALAVWQFIRDRLDDKKYDRAWTPVWEVLLKDLARLTRCSSQQLTGCWRPCPVFDHALLAETGEVIDCCGRYGYPGNRELPGERPMCRYWSAGVFQLLAEHGLAAVRQIGTAARNTRFAVQIYRWPPLLTPWQTARFSDEARQAHAGFLGELGIDLSAWQQVEAVSLMRVWFDRSGLVLDDGGVLNAIAFKNPAESNVLNAIAFKNFFLPADQMQAHLKPARLHANGGDLHAD
jgi:hypothetical protein